MALPKNRKAVVAILDEISPSIIGYRPRYFPSVAGDIAKKIVPSGDLFPSDEVRPLLWEVIVVNEKNRTQYTLCLDAFVPLQKLEAIFDRHFGSAREVKNPFALITAGQDRVAKGYPAAIRIRDNADITQFSYDWGADQELARKVCMSFPHGDLKLEKSTEIEDLILLLRTVSRPVLYIGGPAPQLRFESRWLDNYESALDTVLDAKRVVLGLATYNGPDITYVTSTTLTFYK